MLPVVIGREIEEGIKSFLRSTFRPHPAFEHTLETFLNEPGRVFKGPYYTLRLPFRPAPPGPLPFDTISFPYPPHLHQAQAFDRLCADPPRSTLVATGTGSGKTDCFLYPILNACAARIGEPGIKASSSTDERPGNRPGAPLRAGRAQGRCPSRQGDVGLYIGGESDESVVMTPDSVITQGAHAGAPAGCASHQLQDAGFPPCPSGNSGTLAQQRRPNAPVSGGG